MSEIKKIIVFGSTGKTGVQILKRGLLEDLEVTAFARDPNRIPAEIRKLCRVIQGDVTNRESVMKAIRGHDVVISALGERRILGEHTVRYIGCKNIIEGMKTHNITKLVTIGTANLLSGEKKPFYPRPNKDHFEQVKLLRNEESIEWILMMAPNILDSSHVELEYKVEKNKVPGAYVVTAGELADFMVKVFMDRTSTECFRHSMLGISSHPKLSTTSEFRLVVFSLIVCFIAFLLLYHRCLPGILQEYADEIIHEAKQQ